MSRTGAQRSAGRSGRLVAALAVVLPAAATAAAASFRLAGDTRATWLALSERGVYELAVKGLDEPWSKLPVKARGRIEAMAVTGQAAAVFFASGGNQWYYPDQQGGRRGLKPSRALWPRGTLVLSACPAGVQDRGAVLVLVRRPARRPPGTAPATAPGGGTRPAEVRLALLRCARDGWRELAVFEPPVVTGRALMARAGPTVYVLLQAAESAFLAVEDDKPRRLALPEGVDPTGCVGLIGLDDRVVLAAANHPAGGRLALAVYEDGRWGRLRPVQRGQTLLTWPEQLPPAVARHGRQLAVVWQDGQRYRFVPCGEDGKVAGTTTDIFSRAQAIETVDQIWRGFIYLVPLVMIALMLWPGQPLRTGPFSLPGRLRPAGVLKRAIAFLIDVLPFVVTVLLVLGPDRIEDLRRALERGQLTVENANASLVLLAALAAYPGYCILLEHLYGATLGKLALRLRVVGEGGRKASLREVALRNVSKLPEMVPPLMFVPLITRYRQRLGDKIAWTAVIDLDRSMTAQAEEPPEPDRRTDEDRSEGP